MNKSIEAFLRGYMFFKVNNKFFLFYNSALKERKRIQGFVNFVGYNIFLRGWRGFYIRIMSTERKAMTVTHYKGGDQMKKLFAILILYMMLLGCSGGSGGSDGNGHNDNGSGSDSAPLSTDKSFVWNQSNWDEAVWQ